MALAAFEDGRPSFVPPAKLQKRMRAKAVTFGAETLMFSLLCADGHVLIGRRARRKNRTNTKHGASGNPGKPNRNSCVFKVG